MRIGFANSNREPFRSAGARVRVGRADGNDLVLSGAGVAERHLAIAEDRRGLVLEVAFEGLQRSSRHKSGLAMRFPRINRLRWDKPPGQADRLDRLETLLRYIEQDQLQGQIA